MKKYIIYARVASRNQADRNVSITHQVETLKRLAKVHDIEDVETYTEICSANSNVRQLFHQMMDKIFNNEANGILCMSLDRLSRNFITHQIICNAIETKGIRIITPYQIYSNNSETTFLMSLEVAMNKYEKILRGQRIKAGMKRREGK